MSGEKVFDSQWIPKWFFICLVKWKFHLNSSIHFDLMSFFFGSSQCWNDNARLVGCLCASLVRNQKTFINCSTIYGVNMKLFFFIKLNFIKMIFCSFSVQIFYFSLRLQSAHDLWEINAMRWYNGSAAKTLVFLAFFRAKFRKLCFHHRRSSSSKAIVVVALVEIYVHLNCSK